MRRLTNRYRLARKPTLVAHDLELEGQFKSRTTFLYKDSKGRFFALHTSVYEDEDNFIDRLSLAEAKRLYEKLRYHQLEYDNTFGKALQKQS